MGTKKYLIDTNAVIDYLGELMPDKALKFIDKIIDDEFYLSVINKIELLGFAQLTIDEEQKIQLLIDSSQVIELTNDIVNKTIALRKNIKIKLPDGIIAASASVHNLAIVTRNTDDFDKIQELEIINPYQL